ncbi:MAG: protein kinase [bacterium]|nr:protein kinase [bacterium]
MSTSSAIPFVVGQWVRGEKFYGRGTQIAEILGGHRNWVWLLGNRRVGKTSLLKQLEHLTATRDQGFFPVFWDFQGADDPEELNLNFADALLDAEERLDELGIAVAEVEGEDLFAALGRLRRKLRAQKRTLLLLCDEVEELIHLREKDPALLRKLRRAMQSQEGIRSVLASSIRLWDLAEQREDTSPFLHGFIPPLYIQNLSDEEARSLIRQEHLPADGRPHFEDEVVERIRRRCDNHPYLIQLVCKRYLELGDLAEACEQVATDPMVSYFFSVDFETLSETERGILHFISEQTMATSKSIQRNFRSDSGSLSGGLQRLENLGFIRRDAERRFVLASFFFRRWLRELPRQRDLPAGPAPPRRGGLLTSTETALGYDVRMRKIDDRYELRKEVGRGASGIVFRAYDTLLETEVAVKLLGAQFSAGRDALERVRQEIILSRDIGHPNILRIYHLGAFGDHTYLTMQWVEGPTLSQVIAEQAPLPRPRTLGITAKLSSALAAAHRRKILHRDIKPSNILLDEQGEPYLADFGLARLIGAPGITGEGLFIGTPYYASPEQAEMRALDERSDLYSLGLVLFEMTTGRRPFEADTSQEVLEMRRRVPPPDPRELEPTVSPGLAELILHCLEKEPEKRCPSAEALEAALLALAESVD